MDILYHRLGDAETVIGAGPPPDLIEDDERPGGGIMQDIGCLHHLHHKGGLTGRQVLLGAHPGKDAIYQTNTG